MLLVKEKVSCLQLTTLLFSIIYTTNDLKTFITSKTQTTHNVAINVMPEDWGGGARNRGGGTLIKNKMVLVLAPVTKQ